MKLKQLRLEKGFTQEQLAQKAGVSLETIRNVELFKVKPNRLTKMSIAKALWSKVDDIEWEVVQ